MNSGVPFSLLYIYYIPHSRHTGQRMSSSRHVHMVWWNLMVRIFWVEMHHWKLFDLKSLFCLKRNPATVPALSEVCWKTRQGETCCSLVMAEVKLCMASLQSTIWSNQPQTTWTVSLCRIGLIMQDLSLWPIVHLYLQLSSLHYARHFVLVH